MSVEVGKQWKRVISPLFVTFFVARTPIYPEYPKGFDAVSGLTYTQ